MSDTNTSTDLSEAVSPAPDAPGAAADVELVDNILAADADLDNDLTSGFGADAEAETADDSAETAEEDDVPAPKVRLSSTERDRIAFAEHVYDENTPVLPAWQGEQVFSGVRIVAGRDHVTDACDELIRRGVPLASDIETSGTSALHRYQIKVVVFATGDLCVALDPRDPMQRQQIVRMYEAAPALIFHNCSFDVPILTTAGLMTLEQIDKVHDTILMSRLAYPSKNAQHGLASVIRRELGLETGDIAAAFKARGFRTKSSGFELADINMQLYLRSAALDAAYTARLAPILWDRAVRTMTENHPFTGLGADHATASRVIEREHIVQRVMLMACARGYLFDHDAYDAYYDKTETELESASTLLSDAGLRPGVGADLVKRLESDGVLPADWKRTATGQLSAAKGDLASPAIADHPLVKAHRSVAEINKVRKDYLDKMRDFIASDGRMHPQVTCLAAVTGRMSAGDPPIQQFPLDARPMILADDPGGWVSIDYSAVEPLVAAYSSGQLDLAYEIVYGGDAYVPIAKLSGLMPQDLDMETAKNHPGRKKAKTVFLGLLYGTGSAKLATQLGIEDIIITDSGRPFSKQAQALKDQVLAGIPEIGKWMDTLRNTANQHGMTMTAAGRIANVDSDPITGEYKGYQAQNYFHQGSAYDLLADAIAEIHRQGWGGHVRFAIHDELVVTAEASEAVQHIMRNTAPSLDRFLIGSAEARRAVFGTEKFEFPIDAHPLPHHWMKV